MPKPANADAGPLRRRVSSCDIHASTWRVRSGAAMDNLILVLVAWIPVAGVVLALCIGPDEAKRTTGKQLNKKASPRLRRPVCVSSKLRPENQRRKQCRKHQCDQQNGASASKPAHPEMPADHPALQILGRRSKYSSSSFFPPSPAPNSFSDRMNSIRSIHLTIL